jgi:3'-phosphoadenosine 5'-phosphosulfate sulfotransferase (PAPS reductase)/FAD synthetase
MVYVASVSFGKDSLAMLLRLIEEDWPLDHVVFFDTGMEYQAIYNNMEKIKPLLKEKGIKFRILKPKYPFLYNMLERDINARDGRIKTGGRGWCGGAIRWGTSEKLSKIDSYYNELSRGYETIVNYVGIAADETERINRKRDELKVNIYPLIEWGMDEASCLQYCYDKGYNWSEEIVSDEGTKSVDLYKVLDRVSCWCCRNKTKEELYNMYLYLPNYWEKLKDLQRQIETPYKTYGTVFDIEKEFEARKIFTNQ